jgi:hypothetical protein
MKNETTLPPLTRFQLMIIRMMTESAGDFLRENRRFSPKSEFSSHAFYFIAMFVMVASLLPGIAPASQQSMRSDPWKAQSAFLNKSQSDLPQRQNSLETRSFVEMFDTKIGVDVTTLQGKHGDDLDLLRGDGENRLDTLPFFMYGGEMNYFQNIPNTHKITFMPYAFRTILDTGSPYVIVWNEPEVQPDGSPGHTSQWTNFRQPSMSEFVMWYQGVEWRDRITVFGNNRNPQNSIIFYNEFVAAFNEKLGRDPEIDVIGTHCHFMTAATCEEGLLELHAEIGKPVAVTEFSCDNTDAQCYEEYRQLMYKYDWIEFALYFANYQGDEWWALDYKLALVDNQGELTTVGTTFTKSMTNTLCKGGDCR